MAAVVAAEMEVVTPAVTVDAGSASAVHVAPASEAMVEATDAGRGTALIAAEGVSEAAAAPEEMETLSGQAESAVNVGRVQTTADKSIAASGGNAAGAAITVAAMVAAEIDAVAPAVAVDAGPAVAVDAAPADEATKEAVDAGRGTFLTAGEGVSAVSYTHLTLPTIYSV